MADVKMIATRESYGNTLKALAAEGHDDLVVLGKDRPGGRPEGQPVSKLELDRRRAEIFFCAAVFS